MLWGYHYLRKHPYHLPKPQTHQFSIFILFFFAKCRLMNAAIMYLLFMLDPVSNSIWDDPQHKKTAGIHESLVVTVTGERPNTVFYLYIRIPCPRHIFFVVCVVQSHPTKRSTWKKKQQPANNNNNNNNNNKKHNPHVHINHHHPHQSKPLRRIVRIEGSEALRPMSASSSPATPRKCLLAITPSEKRKKRRKNREKSKRNSPRFTILRKVRGRVTQQTGGKPGKWSKFRH